MMGTTSKESSPPKTTANRLPSFSTLLQTSQRLDLSPTRHHSPESSLTIASATHSPQLSLSNPPSSLTYQPTEAYSYRKSHHSRDESYPLQFKFPEQGVVLTRDGPPQHHFTPIQHRRTQSTSINFSVPSTEKEEDIIVALSSSMDSLRDIENFTRTFGGQYNSMMESGRNAMLQGGGIGGGNISKQALEKFVGSFSVRELDNVLGNCDSLKALMQRIKCYMLEASGSHPILGGVVEGSSSVRQTVSAHPASPTKKRKKSAHERSISAGGEVIPMRINPQVRTTEGHQERIDQGGLNPDLSIRERIITCKHCGAENTPEWRSGPDGSRTLCNACGLFYSKLIRKHGLPEAVRIMRERKIDDPTDRRIL